MHLTILDKPVDWWALGVMTYEFLTGIPPFNAETPQQIFENILNRSIPPVRVPEEISETAWDFLNRLMEMIPENRLGYNGAAEVKAHPYFKGINWDTLLEQPAIFVPKTRDSTDVSYFDGT
jgi:serine/threonine protein kinase